MILYHPMSDTYVVPQARLTPIGLYGLVGLAIAMAVHASTFTADPMSPEHPLFWILHVGIFPLFFAMLLRLRVWSERIPGRVGRASSRLRWRELRPYFPQWTVTLGAILFAYALVNFLLSVSHLPPSHRGPHVPVTLEQARYTVRAFSGHWMIFYAVPAMFFAFVPSAARPAESSATSIASGTRSGSE